MEPNTTMLPLPELSPEVLAFAEERGVSAYLPAIQEMTRTMYPQATIQVLVVDDPELCDNRQIVFEVVGRVEVLVFLGQRPGDTARTTTRNDGDFVDGIGQR